MIDAHDVCMRGSMVICVCIWRVSMMLMHVCMERIMICSCVYGSVSLSLVFVCEQVAICFAKMLIHFHFGKTLAFRKGPNFRIGHAEIFYRPLHACIHYVVLIDFKIVPCTSCRQKWSA